MDVAAHAVACEQRRCRSQSRPAQSNERPASPGASAGLARLCATLTALTCAGDAKHAYDGCLWRRRGHPLRVRRPHDIVDVHLLELCGRPTHASHERTPRQAPSCNNSPIAALAASRAGAAGRRQLARTPASSCCAAPASSASSRNTSSSSPYTSSSSKKAGAEAARFAGPPLAPSAGRLGAVPLMAPANTRPPARRAEDGEGGRAST